MVLIFSQELEEFIIVHFKIREEGAVPTAPANEPMVPGAFYVGLKFVDDMRSPRVGPTDRKLFKALPNDK